MIFIAPVFCFFLLVLLVAIFPWLLVTGIYAICLAVFIGLCLDRPDPGPADLPADEMLTPEALERFEQDFETQLDEIFITGRDHPLGAIGGVPVDPEEDPRG